MMAALGCSTDGEHDVADQGRSPIRTWFSGVNCIIEVGFFRILAAPATPEPTELAPTATVTPQPQEPTVTAELEEPTAMPEPTAEPAEPEAQVLLEERCTTCHGRDRVKQAQKSREAWATTVDRMMGYGAQLSQSEREVLLDYLVETYGP